MGKKMKVEELKLYNKYKNINDSNTEYIYVGIDNENKYWFLFKNEYYNSSFIFLKHYGFDPDKIVKDLNLETFIDENGKKCIKGYSWVFYKKERIEKYFKPITPLEIEYKYLLKYLPSEVKDILDVYSITQKYVDGIRYRRVQPYVYNTKDYIKYYRTEKKLVQHNPNVYEENECEINEEEYRSKTYNCGKYIVKTRYKYKEWDIDVIREVNGKPAYMILAEYEVKDKDEKPNTPEEIQKAILMEVNFSNFDLVK